MVAINNVPIPAKIILLRGIFIIGTFFYADNDRVFMWSASLMLILTIVSVGFTAPLVGKTDEPAM